MSVSLSFAKSSDHVTTMMHKRSLVHYLIAETYNNCSFYQQAPVLQNYAVTPLLLMSDQRQHRCTGT